MSAPNPSLAPGPEGESQWSIVRRQFRRNRPAVWGLRVALVLLALAIYAPVLASSHPLLWREGSGGWSSPWLERLFDVIAWEHGVDRFFNSLMVTTTVGLLLAGAVRLAVRSAQGRRAWWRAAGRPLLFAALALALVQGSGLFFVRSLPAVDYRARFQELTAQGVAVDRVRTVVPYGHREQLPGREDQFLTTWSFERGERHVLGTDEVGRDVFARILYGTRISLTIGIVAVAIYVAIGTVLGAIAGYLGGKADLLIMRLVEIMICIPPLFLLMTIVALFNSRSIFLIMVSIGVVSWTGVCRLVRGQILRERSLDYVTAARGLGLSTPRIIFHHVLPNAFAPVLVAATFGVAGAILTESTLSFIGLGDLTVPSWGRILDDGRVHVRWHLILPPSLAIFITVLSLNLVGDGVRDALDPKLRN